MAVEVKITCTLCGDPIGVQMRRAVDTDRPGLVFMRVLDTAPLVQHMNTCTGKPAKALAVTLSVAKTELVGRIRQLLDTRAYVAQGGSRACTMCGMNGDTCLAALSSANLPCCNACREGNTHPAPGEAQGTCAQWAEQNGAKA